MYREWLERFDSDEWRVRLRPLLAEDIPEGEAWKRIADFNDSIRELDRRRQGGETQSLSVSDGITLLRLIGSRIEIGGEKGKTFSSLPLYLEGFRHPRFINTILEQFEVCPDDQKAYLLSVLACQEPEQAGRALKTLIEMHGFPSVYPRVFWNLEKNIQGVRHYIREFIRKPGRYIGHATDLVNRALELGLIETEYLDELAPLIEEQTAQAVTTVLEAQDRINRRWQLDRDYFYARIDLGAWLDLTGLVRKCGSTQMSRAVSSEDPLVNVFNAAAFLSKKMNVPQSVISRSADSLETVRGLYRTLLAKDRPDLFPASRLTFETFAAAEMVEWLLYPSELGEEPKSITLEKTIDGKDRGGKFHRYCLWRFFDHEENDYAGVSGPYDQASIENPTPDTVVSDETFSNFERWDSLTPEQHLEGVLATLESWRVGGALDD